jgi:hypothetical protein
MDGRRGRAQHRVRYFCALTPQNDIPSFPFRRMHQTLIWGHRAERTSKQRPAGAGKCAAVPAGGAVAHSSKAAAGGHAMRSKRPSAPTKTPRACLFVCFCLCCPQLRDKMSRHTQVTLRQSGHVHRQQVIGGQAPLSARFSRSSCTTKSLWSVSSSEAAPCAAASRPGTPTPAPSSQTCAPRQSTRPRPEPRKWPSTVSAGHGTWPVRSKSVEAASEQLARTRSPPNSQARSVYLQQHGGRCPTDHALCQPAQAAVSGGPAAIAAVTHPTPPSQRGRRRRTRCW